MKKVKTIFAKIFGVEEKSINNNSSPENIESWDSFNSLMLISELESNFNIKFNTSEIVSAKNFGDIISILRKHGFEQ